VKNQNSIVSHWPVLWHNSGLSDTWNKFKYFIMSKRLILAINPGSTSTKFAIFEEENLIFEKTLRHQASELEGFPKVTDQFHFRKDLIMKELAQ